MPLPVPARDPITFVPRYYTADEYAQIDLKRRGVSGEGDHFAESLGPDGCGTPRMYSCRWAERYAAALTLVGWTETYPDPGPGPNTGKLRINRLLPDTYGAIAGQQWFCTKVRLSPFRYLGVIDTVEEGLDAPTFDRCDIEATYELAPYELREDGATAIDNEQARYLIKPGFPTADVSTTSTYITLPGGSLKYVTATGAPTPPAGVPIHHGIGFVENGSDLAMVWKRVPPDVFGESSELRRRVKGQPGARGMIGSLNKTTFLGYPPLTLQLRGVEEKLLPDPMGIGYSWDLTYKMNEKPVPFGHLGFYYHSTANPALAKYYEVLRAGLPDLEIAAGALAENDSLFHVKEFNELFIPEL